MANYRDFIRTRQTENTNVVATPVNTIVIGRESEMVPSSGGQGFTFKVDEISQFKRWLVFGSTGATMYDSAKKMTVQNLDIIKSLMSRDYKTLLDIAHDFSVRNIVKGQTTLLTALSMALAYDDQTIRVYRDVDINKFRNTDFFEADLLSHENVTSYKMPGTVHRLNIGDYGNTDLAYVMVYDKAKSNNYRYLAVDLNNGNMTNLKSKDSVLWQEGFAARPDSNGLYVVAVDYSLSVKRYAFALAGEMLRQSSMLFEAIANTDAQRGWGSMMHKLIDGFYGSMNNADLAQQFVKYGTRQGWSHKDLLRKAKPVTTHHTQRALRPDGTPKTMSMVVKKEDLYVKTDIARPDPERAKIYGWAVDKFNAFEQVTPSDEKDERGYIKDPLSKLWAADALKHAVTADQVAQIVSTYQLPREAVERANTKWLTEKVVWESLLENMPGVAMVRNLRNMAQIGLLEPLSATERFIADKLGNARYMGRVHPIQVMQAAVSYNPSIMSASEADNAKRTRQITNGDKPYKVSQVVMNALDAALMASYKNVTPSNKRIMMSVDISGSMYWNMLPNLFPFFPGEAAGIMAMIFANIESTYYPTVFSGTLGFMNLSNKSTIADVLTELRRHSAGATNLGLPLEYAINNKLEVDAFIAITDVQVNTGRHTFQLIKEYRQKSGIPAKFITVAMEANALSVADPNDPLMLDVVGCSSETQDLVISYIRGEFQ